MSGGSAKGVALQASCSASLRSLHAGSRPLKSRTEARNDASIIFVSVLDFEGLVAYALFAAATPGRSFPSKNSKEAPPPVEICVILSPKPSWFTAAALCVTWSA